MIERDWDDVMMPRDMPISVGVWVTDDPYVQCNLCGTTVIGEVNGVWIDAATLGELVDLFRNHYAERHDG